MATTITKTFRFEMSHILSNYDGPCGNLHGHSYKCLVTFTADEEYLSGGMVADFGVVKRIVNEIIIDKLDHCFAYNLDTTDPFEKAIMEACTSNNKKIYGFNFRTTAENMAYYIFREIRWELLNRTLDTHGVRVSKVVLYETETGCAEYTEGE